MSQSDSEEAELGDSIVGQVKGRVGEWNEGRKVQGRNLLLDLKDGVILSHTLFFFLV